MQGVLTQFDWGIRFESDEIGLIHNINPTRSCDGPTTWGTRWEHKRGVVRRVSEQEQRAPQPCHGAR